LVVVLIVTASCASDVAAPLTVAPPLALPSPQPAVPDPPVSTNAVVLSFLTSGVSDTTLVEGEESVVQQFGVYAPCHPLFGTMSGYSIRPVTGCPLPYKVWETQLDVAPATVMNASSSPAVLTATVYSDNAYVYQEQQTIQPGSRAVVSFGSYQLGYVCSDGFPMLITVSLRASGADLVLIRSTAELAGVFASKFPDYPKVWGSAVVLLPLDTQSGVCSVAD
jgi:hypothetical protein